MHTWSLFYLVPEESMRRAEQVELDPHGGAGRRYLSQCLAKDSLLRAQQIRERLRPDEAEVFRADGANGARLDVVVFAGAEATYVLLGPSRPHSSGLIRLGFVYSSLARSRDAVIFTDASGTVLGASERWRRLYGYEPVEVLCHNPRLVNSRKRPRGFFRAIWRDLTHSAGGSWSGELADRKKDGSLVSVWQTITAFRDAQGTIGGYLGITRDVTPYREMVSRLSRSNEELDRSLHRQERHLAELKEGITTSLDQLLDQLQTTLGSLPPGPAETTAGGLTAALEAGMRMRSLLGEAAGSLPRGAVERGPRDREQGAAGAWIGGRGNSSSTTTAGPRAAEGELELQRIYLRSLLRTEVDLKSGAARRLGVRLHLCEDGPSGPCFVDEVRMSDALRQVLGYTLEAAGSGGLVDVRLHSLLGGDQEIVFEARPGGSSVVRRATMSNGSLVRARDIFALHGGCLAEEVVADGLLRVVVDLPLDRHQLLGRPWAAVVFDPTESLWPLVSPLLTAQGVTLFVAQSAEELRGLAAHELPSLLLHPAAYPPPEDAVDLSAGDGEAVMPPARCSLQVLSDGSSLDLVASSGPRQLVRQVRAWLDPSKL